MGSARKAALAALEKCRRQGAWSDAVLGSVMDAEKLGGRDRALAAVRAKTLAPDALRARLLRAASLWEPLRANCDERLMAPERAAAMLHAAGCAVDPAALGLAPARLAASALAAQILSPRYTVLDLAFETGRLAACAQALATSFA